MIELSTVETELIEIADAPTAALSPMLQSIARNYLGARARAGEAILDSARYLAEARAAAKRGEWGVFLEATGTTEDTATRMLAIANRAAMDQQYARAISDGRLAFTAAFELLNAPQETQQRALESDAPTPASAIRAEKQAEKLRTSAEFVPALDDVPPPDLSAYGFSARMLPDGRFAIRTPGNLESQHTAGQLNDLLQFWRGYPPIPADMAACGVMWRYRSDRMYQVACDGAPHHTGYTAAECLNAHREFLERTGKITAAAAVETDDSAIIAEIRAKAAGYGLQLILEDGKAIVYWNGEDVEQMEPLPYSIVLEWLENEAESAWERYKAAQGVLDNAPDVMTPDPAVEMEIKRLCAISGKFSGGGGDYLADAALEQLRDEPPPAPDEPPPAPAAESLTPTRLPPVPTRPKRPASADASSAIAYLKQLETYASALETVIMELQKRMFER